MDSPFNVVEFLDELQARFPNLATVALGDYRNAVEPPGSVDNNAYPPWDLKLSLALDLWVLSQEGTL